MGDIELVRDDGGVLQRGESLQGAGALGLRAEGEAHEGLEMRALEVGHGEPAQFGEHHIQDGGLGEGDLFGPGEVALGDGLREAVEFVYERGGVGLGRGPVAALKGDDRLEGGVKEQGGGLAGFVLDGKWGGRGIGGGVGLDFGLAGPGQGLGLSAECGGHLESGE